MSTIGDPIGAFGLSCPSGGDIHICQGNTTQFLGCCTTNPCLDGSGSCPQENLRPTTFNPDTYSILPTQDCDNAGSIGLWYTCAFNTPPFLGCCASNPCAQGSCPRSDLRPAKLSGNTGLRQKFLSATPSSSLSSSSAAPTSTTTTTSSSPSGTASSAPQVQVASSGLSTGAVVGIAVSIALVAVAFLAFAAFRWGRKGKKDKQIPPAIDAPGYDADTSFVGGHGQYSPYRDSSFTGHTVHGSPSFYQNSPMGSSFYKAGQGQGQTQHYSPTPDVYHYNANPHRISNMTDGTAVSGHSLPHQPPGFEYHSRHHSGHGAATGFTAVHEMEAAGHTSELAGDQGAYSPPYHSAAAEGLPAAGAYDSPFPSPSYPPAAALDTQTERTAFLPQQEPPPDRHQPPGPLGLYDAGPQHGGWDTVRMTAADYDTGPSHQEGMGRR